MKNKNKVEILAQDIGKQIAEVFDFRIAEIHNVEHKFYSKSKARIIKERIKI